MIHERDIVFNMISFTLMITNKFCRNLCFQHFLITSFEIHRLFDYTLDLNCLMKTTVENLDQDSSSSQFKMHGRLWRMCSLLQPQII